MQVEMLRARALLHCVAACYSQKEGRYQHLCSPFLTPYRQTLDPGHTSMRLRYKRIETCWVRVDHVSATVVNYFTDAQGVV